jgi:hypothetical protein
VGAQANRFRACAIACVATASALLASGCAEEIHVRTAEAPQANFSSATTYRLLTPGENRSAITSANAGARPNGTATDTSRGDVAASDNPAQSSNPILQSPIMVQQLRADIERDLDARGYHRETGQADLSVAYYMGVHDRLRVTDYDYGYPFWGWGWRWGPGWGAWPAHQVTQYQQGTIIVDVLDGSGRRLLWRGMAHVDVPKNEQDYAKVVTDGVNAIMQRFPGKASD